MQLGMTASRPLLPLAPCWANDRYATNNRRSIFFSREVIHSVGNNLIPHTVGVKVIAVGVHNDAEWKMLRVLGMDAVTGPIARNNYVA